MPDPTLQGTALRYAAGDLPPAETTAFESRLAHDQDARDALAEAVRLSAAAIGQKPPAPRPSFRAAIRARLARGSRESPFAWIGLGAAAVAACTLVGLSLANRIEPPAAVTPAVTANSPSVEEIPAPRAESSPLAVAPMPRESETIVAAEPPVWVPSPCGGGDPQRSVAEIWADLSTHDNVEKAREELRWRQKRDLVNPHHLFAPTRMPE